MVYFFGLGLPRLQRCLNFVLKRYRVEVTISGIFCHQSPKVYPDYGPRSCELADLTFLATYGRLLPSRGLGNALMVQAKNDYSPGSTLQEQLYQSARKFRYEYSPGGERVWTSVQDALWYWTFNAARRGPGAPWLTNTILARPLTSPSTIAIRMLEE